MEFHGSYCAIGSTRADSGEMMGCCIISVHVGLHPCVKLANVHILPFSGWLSHLTSICLLETSCNICICVFSALVFLTVVILLVKSVLESRERRF